MFKAVYKNSHVILLSEKLYQDISEIVNHEQVSICPNGIPAVERYTTPENHVPKILFLSNLLESKGVFDLLDTCKILKTNGYLFSCVFVGGESKEIDKSRFQEEVKSRGVDDVVSYLGPKYGEAKYRELSSADVFVLPTKNECFPLVLLEAMQQAVPVVSTTVGGIPDIIDEEKSGLIAAVGKPKDLAEKIAFLFDHPDKMKQMGEDAYDRFQQYFTLEKFEKTITDIFSGEIID